MLFTKLVNSTAFHILIKVRNSVGYLIKKDKRFEFSDILCIFELLLHFVANFTEDLEQSIYIYRQKIYSIFLEYMEWAYFVWLLMPLGKSLLLMIQTASAICLCIASFLWVMTDVYLRKVTCPLRVNFEFFIEIAKVDHLELAFIWWQFFSTFKQEKIATKAKLASTWLN